MVARRAADILRATEPPSPEGTEAGNPNEPTQEDESVDVQLEEEGDDEKEDPAADAAA